jgi:ketosteroid isomerase-like protein
MAVQPLPARDHIWRIVDELVDVVRAIYSAFNAGEDDQAYAHMTDDVQWRIPRLGADIKGKARCRDFWDGINKDYTITEDLVQAATRGNFVVAFVDLTTVVKKSGERTTAPGCQVFRFDGRLVADYFSVTDPAAV